MTGSRSTNTAIARCWSIHRGTSVSTAAVQQVQAALLGADQHYDLMTVEQIEALPLSGVAAEDEHARQALELVRGWQS